MSPAEVAGTVHDRLGEALGELLTLVPPIDPPGCYWLNSDASASYCWPCAREAAWRELPTIGPAPAELDCWHRDPQEELIRDRIDGPASGESDCCETCETCGCTLSYLLTDYGQDEELAHFAENPIKPGDTVNGELTYALSRAFMDLDWQGADPAKAAAAFQVVQDAIACVRAHLLAQEGR